MQVLLNVCFGIAVLLATHYSVQMAAAQSVWREASAAEMEGLKIPAVPREFRGVWVATVQNIDWPSRKGLSAAEARAEIVRDLDVLKGINCNAVLVQVRPSADALYRSTIEPWSEYLTGANGKAPDADWDPLEVWIEEGHKRAIDVHAWVNPFRARHFKAESPDAKNAIAKLRPELVREYDGYEWLDPGEPEAVDHVFKVIRDIVTRYDLDGVVIDDYFYPYPKDNLPFPDDASYTRYTARLRADAPPGTAIRPPNVANWRQGNINAFVRRWYAEIKGIRPGALVGIAPFGIWRPGNPEGVKGMDSVEKLHADARQWMREGVLDYFSPQLYWKIDAPDQPYENLLDWWLGENIKERHVWVSNYASRVGNPEEAKTAWAADEIVKQIDLTRARAQRRATGNILFSLRPILEDRGGLRTELAKVYAQPALIPETPWLAGEGSKAPEILIMVGGDEKKVSVAWCVRERMHGAATPSLPPTPPLRGGASDTDLAKPRSVARIAVWVRHRENWTFFVMPGALFGGGFEIGAGVSAFAIAPVDGLGRIGAWAAYLIDGAGG